MAIIRLSDDPDPTTDYHLRERLQKLEAFYKEVAQLTFDHDMLVSDDSGVPEDYAVVFPDKLEKELKMVDPEWYKNT